MKQIAVVDLGTNAMRLAIGQGGASRYEIIKYIRYPNRLSEGMFADGMLKQPAIRRTLAALAEIKSILETYKVEKIRLISTSVLRTAKNARQFVTLVKEKTGFVTEILSGAEEARLIHIGAVSDIEMGDKKALIVDIGGGSTELSIGDHSGMELAVSIESGAVRLKEKFIHHDPPAVDELVGIFESVDNDFEAVFKRISGLKPDMQVGVPGNIGAIYNILKPADGLAIDSLKRFYDKLSVLRIEEIKHFTDLENDKSDVLLPGLMILIKIMDAVNITKCYLSQKGLLHGIITTMFSV